MSLLPPAAGAVRGNSRAIAIICAGMFCLVVNDAIAKWLLAHYAPLQIVFLRNLLALPMVVAVVAATWGWDALRTRKLAPHAVRGLLLVSGAVTFFLGLEALPLAEATALIFAAPIFITALSVPLLREHVGWRRWMAVVVGFAGVLIIVRPGAAAFQPASLYVVATALIHALMMLSARWVDHRDGLPTLTFYVVLFPLLFASLAVPLVWRPLDPAHLPILAAMAVFGTAGMTLISQAFRMAPAAVVAPFDYTALVWASAFGWLIWSEIPAVWTYVGAAVIVASAIYIVLRETRNARGE